MKRMLAVFLVVMLAVGVIGVAGAVAARSGGLTTPRADCPYAKDGAPIRARDGSGQQANRSPVSAAKAKAAKARAAKAQAGQRAGAQNGTQQRVRAQDGTGVNAQTNVPRGDCDGTGPHGPYNGGR
ncbi:MAG: hypothetical protein WBQ14_08170 [Gaiellaceae bacterium]